MLVGTLFVVGVGGLAVTSRSSHLVRELQTCFTPQHVLDRVGKPLAYKNSDLDEFGSLARLVLVRLSKQWIAIDNQERYGSSPNTGGEWWKQHESTTQEACALVDAVVALLLKDAEKADAPPSYEQLVEGSKAFSVIARLVPIFSTEIMLDFWDAHAATVVPHLETHEISGAYWAIEGMLTAQTGQSKPPSAQRVPEALQVAWERLDLPFRIFPNAMTDVPTLSLENVAAEVEFRVDEIRTVSNKLVKERRQTAWEGDEGVGPFLYSDKEMPRLPWSPTVRLVRDVLADSKLGHGQYYDCCLLNMYPNGGSGMRYHIDPDQGSLWDFDTSVVSVGATRRFAFRANAKDDATTNKPHTFVVLHGDLTYMFGRCQDEYQHCVKKAETKGDDAARASMVFKRSWKQTSSGNISNKQV